MTERVKCLNVGCEKCSKGIRVGESLLGDDLYSCSAYKRKHKKVNARDCGAFRCNDPEFVNFCRDCRRGK